jgi:hypothetical protein
MSKPIRLIAVLLICAVLLPAAGSPFLSASAAPLATSPSLGVAGSYSVLAGSSVTNAGLTHISGDMGISPGAALPPNFTDNGTVTLDGTLYDTGADALAAQGAKNAAYDALAAQDCDFSYLGAYKELAGEILLPGVHCATSFHLTSGTLTLDGSASDVWIFKSASDLIITGGSSTHVVFTNGGLPCNVWWWVVSTATFDANSSLVGNILADTSITLAAGASLDGRALARTAEVTLSSNNITGPTCGSTAVGLREFQATSAAGSPIGLGAGAGLLLAVGLIVIRRRVLATPNATPSARQGHDE